MTRYKGTVALYNNLKGVGFLTREDGVHVLCHHNAIHRAECPSLMDGEQVEFDVVQGTHGLEARDIIALRDTEANAGRSYRVYR